MTTIKMGLEKEFFITKKGKPLAIPSNFPRGNVDECGWLAEARGKPELNIIDAVFSLKADIFKLKRTAKKFPFILDDTPNMVIPTNIKVDAQRRFAKGLISYQNIYGHTHHPSRDENFSTAGVHITFSFRNSHYIKNNKYFYYDAMWDFKGLFELFDKKFEKEIKESKRAPGFYEVKGDGRIEYRSLPANISLKKVIKVISKINLDSYVIH